MTQTPIKPESTNIINNPTNIDNLKTPKILDHKKNKPIKNLIKNKKKSFSLGNKLLITFIPTLLIALGLAGFLGYRNIHEKEEDKIIKKLVEQTLLTGEGVSVVLKDAEKITNILVKNPLLVDASSQGALKAETEGLVDLPIAELETKFQETKLLEKNQFLNNYLQNIVENTELAEIFFTDKYGFNIAYSNPTSDFVQRDETWWQQAEEKGKYQEFTGFDESSQTSGLELSQKIVDPQSGEFLGVIKAILPTSRFEIIATYLEHTGIEPSQIIQLIAPKSSLVFNTVTSANTFLEQENQVVGGELVVEIAKAMVEAIENPGVNLQDLPQRWQNNDSISLSFETYEHETGEVAIIGNYMDQDRHYVLTTIPNTPWVAISSIKNREIQLAGTELIEIFVIITLILGGVGTGIVSLLANNLTKPLQELSETAQEFAEGNLDIVAKAQGMAETETLADTFNNLVETVKSALSQQEIALQKTQLLGEISAAKILTQEDIDRDFNQALAKGREILEVDRLLVYSFKENYSGYISHEAVRGSWIKSLNYNIKDDCIPEELIAAYRNGRVLANQNVFKAGFHPEHLQLMEDLGVKANLIVPILSQGKLYGLLIAHHCTKTYFWQEEEIAFMEQLGTQFGLIVDRLDIIKQQQLSEIQQKEEKEKLQKRALELLMEVDPISRGDLTIRARVEPDEIGTIADSYNATIENLGKIVRQVKNASFDMTQTTNTNEELIQSLAIEAQRQAEDIVKVLERIQSMDDSLRQVALSAIQAEAAAQQASLTVKTGDEAMNKTVESIMTLKNSAQETVNKVRKLGETSEKISEVVSLITTFAAQTHLLALKASIEAARAGEEGVGFAVIADEVRDLAAQSAQATEQIELFVKDIQEDTQGVVTSMENSTLQVETSSNLIEQTRSNLSQITAATSNINQLVEAINQATTKQGEDSEIVNEIMTEIADIAKITSTNALNVSESFKKLLIVTEQLQETVSKFKVN